MGNLNNLLGQRFGRLIVIAQTEKRSNRREARWLCRCDCGNEKTFAGWRLNKGYATSCGCLFIEQAIQGSTTHGGSRTRTFKVWGAMRYRCTNPNDTSYPNYGGRGIRVCDRWGKFENFLADMGEAPEGMSIERIDNNADYSPLNCKWATSIEQGNNKRNNHILEYQGRKLTIAQWAREINIPTTCLYQRIQANWDTDRALNEPYHGHPDNERAHQLAYQGMKNNGGAR